MNQNEHVHRHDPGTKWQIEYWDRTFYLETIQITQYNS
jgi:hypothetical protein